MKLVKTLYEVCDEFKITRRMVQGYEKAGLVSPFGRNKYGHLLYDEECVERIRLVRFYQQMGFHLKEISGLIDALNDEKKSILSERVAMLESEHKEMQMIICRAKEYILTL